MYSPHNMTPKNYKDILYFNSICEALTCSFKATEKIEVDIGKLEQYRLIPVTIASTFFKNK